MAGLTRREIAEAWADGKPARGASALRTDGTHVWSYSLMIGTVRDGKRIAFDFRGDHFQSVTTSHHVGAIAWRADEVVTPPDGHGRNRCVGMNCEHREEVN